MPAIVVEYMPENRPRTQLEVGLRRYFVLETQEMYILKLLQALLVKLTFPYERSTGEKHITTTAEVLVEMKLLAGPAEIYSTRNQIVNGVLAVIGCRPFKGSIRRVNFLTKVITAATAYKFSKEDARLSTLKSEAGVILALVAKQELGILKRRPLPPMKLLHLSCKEYVRVATPEPCEYHCTTCKALPCTLCGERSSALKPFRYCGKCHLPQHVECWMQNGSRCSNCDGPLEDSPPRESSDSEAEQETADRESEQQPEHQPVQPVISLSSDDDVVEL